MSYVNSQIYPLSNEHTFNIAPKKLQIRDLNQLSPFENDTGPKNRSILYVYLFYKHIADDRFSYLDTADMCSSMALQVVPALGIYF